MELDAAFISFLLRAKRNTYAAKGTAAAPSRPLSHDLRFEEGELLYIDTYLGGEHFAGEEGVWHNGNPVWAMNYSGRVLADGFSGDFLKAALLRGTTECPYRGPSIFSEDAFLYHSRFEGSISWFQGREEIYRSETLVYECLIHGGKVI